MKTVFTNEYEVLLQALIAGRNAVSLTQADLAYLLRKPQSFVSKYERGERRLDVVELIEICGLIKLDPHAIIDAIQLASSTDEGGE